MITKMTDPAVNLEPVSIVFKMLIVADRRLIKAQDYPGALYLTDANEPDEIISAADSIQSQHVVLPLTELVVKTLMEHPVHRNTFLVLGEHKELNSPDSLIKRYGIWPQAATAFIDIEAYGHIVSMMLEYADSPLVEGDIYDFSEVPK